tara:strand:- start:744 stop:1400 length:657 start_codon:yes stop_codon:yes gene_type:complete
MVDITAPRMMQDSMIRVYKNAYTDEFCDSVIDTWESLTKTEEEDKNHDWSEVGKRRDKAIFMDEWSDDTSESEIATRRLVAEGVASVLAPSVNAYLKDVGIFNEVYCTMDNVKVQKYDHTRGGGYYVFHSEQSAKNKRCLQRLLTYTVYLNDVPKGEGETEFLNQGFRYQPCKGDLVIFPAFFTHIHRGNPVYTTDKYIATGWMLWSNKPEDEVKSDE